MRTVIFALTLGPAFVAAPLAAQTSLEKLPGNRAPEASPVALAPIVPRLDALDAVYPPAPLQVDGSGMVVEGPLVQSLASDPRIPEPWAPQDPADSLYRAAREALNRNDYDRAAGLFAEIIRRFPRSQYTPDAYYWQAFALYRKGGTQDLRAALDLLERQKSLHPGAATLAENEALATRIRGQLARLGDERAAESLSRSVKGSATSCNAEDDAIRVAALNALLHMDADRAVPILEQVLARRDECSAPLRRKAVFLMSQKVTPRTEEILLGLAQEDPDREVREQAVFWLSQVGSEKAVDALAQILRTSTDAAIQEKAIFALSQHSSRRASAMLREYASRDEVPSRLREHAIFWIGQSGSPEDASFLRDLFSRSADEEIKKKILFSLSQMGGRDNGRWLLGVALDTNAGIEIRKTALFWASQSGVPFEELAALYDRMPERELKEHLIFVFSQRSERAAFDKLIEIARKDPDRELREKAIFWIGQSNDPRATEILLELLTNG